MQVWREHKGEERVGRLSMRVECAKPGAESSERWARRSEALVAWLLDEWEREKEHGIQRSPIDA